MLPQSRFAHPPAQRLAADAHLVRGQAKGRIERLFGTLQDRLVKEMRLREIRTLAGANRFLEIAFWPWWARRFGKRPCSPATPIGDWSRRIVFPRSSACAWRARCLPIIPCPGMGSAGECAARRHARACAALAQRSNGGSTAVTGCVFAAVICPWWPVRRRRDRQLLPAYGLQDSPIANQNPPPKQKPTTARLPPWRKPWKRTFLMR